MILPPASRLLPLVIIVGCAALGERLNHVWHQFLALPAYAAEEAHKPAETPDAQKIADEAAGNKAEVPMDNAAGDAEPAPNAAPSTGETPKAVKPGEEAQGDKLPDPEAEGPAPIVPSELTSAEIGVLQDLSKRREDLEKRSAELDAREALMAAAEQRVSQKVTELQSLKDELNKLLHTIDEQQMKRVNSLVKIYETMKPRDAAAVLEGLEIDVALDVLEHMKENKTAPILAAMNPAKASEITVRMMQRQKLPEIPSN